MSDTMITPEDRERLAKSKFLDWLFEGFDDDRINKKLDERINERITAYASGNRQQHQQHQQQQAQQGDGQQQGFQQPQPTRRRSLLETCLSDTFGF